MSQSTHLYRVGSLAPMDLTQLHAAVHERVFEFDLETWRQSAAGSPHSDTKAMFLRMPPGQASHHSIFEDLRCENRPLMQVPAFAHAVRDVCEFAAAPSARVMIVTLRPGGLIPPHIDEGSYAEATNRYHLCISTNPECYIEIEDERAVPLPGEIWFFNKHARHSVHNAGSTWRVHMIVDVWRPGEPDRRGAPVT